MIPISKMKNYSRRLIWAWLPDGVVEMARPRDPRTGVPEKGFDLIDITTDPAEVGGSLWEMGKGLALYKGFELLPDSKGNGIFSTFYNDTKRNLCTALRAKTFTRYGQDWPFIAHRDAFRRGSSDIKAYYTVTYKFIENPKEKGKNLELPLDIAWKKGRKISSEEMAKEVKELFKATKFDHSKILEYHSRKSDYNNRQLTNHYNLFWSYTGADNRYVNGDLKGREEFDKFFKDFSYLDVLCAQKLGSKKKVYEDEAIEINEYKTSALKKWGCHEGGSLLYDMKDIIYNLAGALGITGSQMFTEREVRNHVSEMSQLPVGRNPLVHYT